MSESIREICVNDIQEAINKENKYFSDNKKRNDFKLRIELCANLNEGGITPSIGILKIAKSVLKSHCIVMLRPRGGDFIYSELEKEVILEDAKIVNELGFFGIAFGALIINEKDELEIDYKLCEKVMKINYNSECTFHMAFDFISDKFKAIAEIYKLGFKRILTRGGINESAIININRINEYYEFIVKNNINLIILPGGGITDENQDEFNNKSKYYFKELHGSKLI